MDTNEGEDVMNTGPCFLPAEVAYSYQAVSICYFCI